MAHSLTTFRNQHVIVNDIDLIVFAELLMAAFDAAGEMPEKVVEMRSSWRESLPVSAPGALDLRLDDYLVGQTEVEFVCRALSATRAAAEAAGTVFSAERLNTIVHHELEFFGERNVADFVRIAEQLSALIGCEADRPFALRE